MEPEPLNQDEVIAQLRIAFARFVDFADTLWAAIGLTPLTPMQREIANRMQDGPDQDFIAAFRGIGKSYLAGAYAIWRLFLDPTEIVLVSSGSPNRAVDFSQWCRRLLDHPGLPFLHFLQPTKGQRDSVLSWDVGPAELTHSASFSAVSVGAANQGRRCTIDIKDDCEQQNNSDSELKRGTLVKQMCDAENMKIPDRECKSLILGTFQSLNSVYKILVAERGFYSFVVPARVPTSVSEYDGNLAPMIAEWAKDADMIGKPTDTRFPEHELRRMEVSLGPIEWQVQMMLSTAVSDRLAHPLCLDSLIVWDGVNPYGAPGRILPGRAKEHRLDDLPCYGLPGDSFYGPSFVDSTDMLPYLTVLMAIDPAGSNGPDEAAYAVLGAVPGALYLLASGGFVKGSDPATLKGLASIAKRHKVKQYLIESNFASWIPLFQQTSWGKHKAEIIEVASKKNKVERMVGALDPVIASGQLIVSRKVFEQEYSKALKEGQKTGRAGQARERLLQSQIAMLRIGEKDGGLAHDDRLDALALGVAHLAPLFLRTDTEQALLNLHEEQAEEDFAEMMDGTLGTLLGRPAQKSGPTWTSSGRSRGRSRSRSRF